MTTTTTVIDGKAVAAELRASVAQRVVTFAEHAGRPPALATVLVGDDPASHVYVGMKHKACAEVGIATVDYPLPADTSAAALGELLGEINANDEIDGILLQLPLPDGLDDAALTELIDPSKD